MGEGVSHLLYISLRGAHILSPPDGEGSLTPYWFSCLPDVGPFSRFIVPRGSLSFPSQGYTSKPEEGGLAPLRWGRYHSPLRFSPSKGVVCLSSNEVLLVPLMGWGVYLPPNGR